MAQLQLSAFDIRASCQKSFNAVIIGKRSSGKSILIQDIMYFLSKTGMPRAVVFSATEESNGFFMKHIPGSFIFGVENAQQKLEDIMASQKRLLMRQRIGEIDKSVDTRLLICLDDIGYKRDVLASPILRQIFLNGRHDSISLIITVQHAMLLRPELRSNSDYIYVFKQNAVSCIKNLHEHYFAAFPTRKEFSLVLSSCTQDFGVLVLDNTKPSTDIPKTVFWYKAKLGREFKLGSKEFWNYHHKWYVSDEERYLRDRDMKQKLGSNSKDGGTIVLKKKHGRK